MLGLSPYMLIGAGVVGIIVAVGSFKIGYDVRDAKAQRVENILKTEAQILRGNVASAEAAVKKVNDKMAELATKATTAITLQQHETSAYKSALSALQNHIENTNYLGGEKTCDEIIKEYYDTRAAAN